MRREVEFRSETPGEIIRADLFTPDTGEGPWPVVIMGGGWCYVKELIMPEYAQFFLEVGVAALIFDYRNFGASDGEPRQHIDPWMQIADYRSAVDAVSYLDEFKADLDPERIAVWGISYSGGHVLAVGALDPRVKCIISQIPVIEGWYNSMRAHGSVGFRELTALVESDRENRYLTGEHGYIPHSGDPKTEVVTWPHPETKPIFMKIKETTAPRHEHYSTVQSVEWVWAYNMRPYLPMILDTPTLMIVAEGDDLTMWEREIPAFNEIVTTKKRLFVQQASTHMSMYSDMSHLEIAAREAADWMREWLIDAYA
ncbi:MAG: alpha/beta fold hydrolase [Acidimicrobiia bacterium]|jgi:acetyl esterase/lipase|nr:alpha/beta fold hydrolase [Acidimicrobiia bacterium]